MRVCQNFCEIVDVVVVSFDEKQSEQIFVEPIMWRDVPELLFGQKVPRKLVASMEFDFDFLLASNKNEK